MRVELGHNLRTEQLLYPIMSPMNLTVSQNIKWLVATAKDGRWPVGYPFEPIRNLSILADDIQVRIEPQHLNTAYNLALELSDIIDYASSDLALSPTTTAVLSFDSHTSSTSDKDNKNTDAETDRDRDQTQPVPTSPTPPLSKDDDGFVSTPIPPTIDHPHDVSDDDDDHDQKEDGWETGTDEDQDQFDLEPRDHRRLNSWSYSVSKSIASTSVSHSGYAASSTSGMGGRWFFQNDLNSMKQSFRTDSDGRPFVNHIIYSEGMEIQAQDLMEHRNNSLRSFNDDDGKDDSKLEDKDNSKKDKDNSKKSKKQGDKLSVDGYRDSDKLNKQHHHRWKTWRYPSPRHVSQVTTSPSYQFLSHLKQQNDDDDDSVSVSTAPSIRTSSTIDYHHIYWSRRKRRSNQISIRR